ncbi:MAG: hypothetical protein CL762_02185 [Chloroflexi bacterium]|nr:hypothetical protein [Chloroflexota bacterium]|tara:strand:- start:906 stop:2123 length:1218 start_codon:yes stop_codon:yes gene_type:complete
MTRCILCENNDVESILDLGLSSVANNLENEQKNSLSSSRIPLVLGRCKGQCGHIQIIDRVDENQIFENYLYTPSNSTTLVAHFKNIISGLRKNYSLGQSSFLIDIGSNDGTFLENAIKYTPNILGVDPAENLADCANKKGIKTINKYFNSNTAKDIEMEYGKADFIISTNTFAHTPEIREFVKGLKLLLKEEGTIVIEVHYLGSLIDGNAFDTIYHEHFSYWSLTNMVRIFNEYELDIFDAEIVDVHHGQLNIKASHYGYRRIKESVNKILQEEKKIKIHSDYLDKFCFRVQDMKLEITNLLSELNNNNKKVIGYGAPAKATTMVNFLDLDLIDKTYDKSTLKQGKYIPGTNIVIKNPEDIIEDNPDAIFIFSWNFVEEIISEIKNKYKYSGEFIIPLPEVKIVR